MIHLERILVGHDFDEAARSALDEMVSVARAFDAELFLAHAIPDVQVGQPEYVAQAAEAADLLGAVRWRLMNRGVRVSPRYLVRPGEPAEALLLAAAEVRPDLIALGVGRRTALDRVLLGNASDQVMRRSSWPVWLVRPGRPHMRLSSILCACDAHPRGDALASAATLARAFGADLSVLTVVPPGRTGGVRWASEALLADLAPGLAQEGIEVEHRVRQGEATSLVVEAANRVRADLIVLGSSFRTSAGSLFGASIAERLLRLLPCSLLAVRAPQAIPVGV